jgi:ribosomal protein S18 acetylase RimI-like enzyme
VITIVDSPSPQRIAAFHDQLVALYRDAFAAPPYSKGKEEVVAFARSLPQHVRREGFRMVVAAIEEGNQVAGFVYGYTSTPDRWWHTHVARAMQPSMADKWLEDCFQLVEIAVTPTFQGQGIGGQLHDHMLNGLSHRKAVLSTAQAKTNAYRMYRRRGWVTLLEHFTFPGVQRPYQILGLDLESRRA